MGALIEHLVESLIAFGCGVVLGLVAGWWLYWRESRWRYIVGVTVGMLILRWIGLPLPGPLQVLVVITLVVAIITCIILAVISRQIPKCQRMLDILADRQREADTPEQ